ncbi:polysaccharide export protein [Aliidiomarina haloalkalitolerans]|uniref:Polysaccharide export protein Wza n=1 Tax=Aliidiomarina haloalkalitolerans TaxID=859059 RepID=A0A432VQY6_9GAMM|nr:polysaccharide export protein [Aliidiomarina haloalkalitolerans]RUO18681.1 polysaccharide export protein Wza [Aliidiomarina haloalkalitolerans]
MSGSLQKLIVATIATVVLSGCAMFPGTHMPTNQDTVNAREDLNEQVRIYAITPSLVNQLRTPQTTPELNPELEQMRAEYDYVVGVGDILNITVWNHPELTIPAGSMRSAQEAGNWVHNDGTIFYPYVGKLPVAGKRVTQIREELIAKLENYIENPQVDVTVAAFRSKRIYVTGEVMQPGTLPITNVPLTLLDAINHSGGITELADWRNVVLTREGREYRFSLQELYQRGDTRQNVLLKAGDVLHVERNDANKVFVMGEVNEPRSVIMGRAGMTLAEAISDVGGINNMHANASGVFVMRLAPNDAENLIDVFQLDARQASALVMADQFRLQERDIVYVTTAPMSRWNRIVSQLLPTAQSLYFLSLTEDTITTRN